MRVALITGGGTGIGLSAARALAGDGFQVVISGRRGGVLAEAVDQIGADGRVHAIEADVATVDEPSRTVDEVVERYGSIDCLVTAAGVYEQVPLLEMTPVQWDETINTNLRGTFLSAQAAARHMVKQGHGRMVFIGSIGATQSEGEEAGHYSASKAGVHSLAQTFGGGLARHGIQVNAVAPGLTETPMTAALIAHTGRAFWTDQLPTGRICQVDEVGEMVRFLVADAPPSLTGAILTIDCGYTAVL